MTAREANVLEVVVLASSTHALLRRRRARVISLLRAKEHILELIHSRVREKQSRIVVRHKRRRVHAAVRFTLKKPQKFFPNLTSRQVTHRRPVYQR